MDNEKHRVPVDAGLEEMLIGAERYAMGRRTYIVSDTVNYLTSLLPWLSDHFMRVVMADIEATERLAQSSGSDTLLWGYPCDKADWMRLKEAIQSEKGRRAGAGE